MKPILAGLGLVTPEEQAPASARQAGVPSEAGRGIVTTRRFCIIVTGSRDWSDRDAIVRRLATCPMGSLVLHGNAPGADTMAHRAAHSLGLCPVPHPYHDEHGKAGGPIRNQLLVDLGIVYAKAGYEVVVEAFPLPGSRGTADCMRRAKKAALLVLEGGRKTGNPAPLLLGQKERNS